MADNYKAEKGSTLECKVVFNEKVGKGSAQIYEVSPREQKLLAFSNNLQEHVNFDAHSKYFSGDAILPNGDVKKEGTTVTFDGNFPFVHFKMETGLVVDGIKCISPMQDSNVKVVAPVGRSNEM